MKPQSRFAQFLDNFISYLKDPNEKNRAAAFGVRCSEGAARAALNRSERHQQISSVRKNTRGLPLGVGVYQVCAAKRIKNALACDPDNANIGETRGRAAETTLDAVRRNAAARARNPRKSKLVRRVAALR